MKTKVQAASAIRTVRDALEWSQERMAREIGCSTINVRVLERDGRLPKAQAVRGNFFRLAEQAGYEVDESPATAAATAASGAGGSTLAPRREVPSREAP